MNNKKNKQNEANETLLGIVLIIVIIGFLTFKFLKQDDLVKNNRIENNNIESNNTETTEYKSKIYAEYLEKLDNLKAENNINNNNENALAKEMTEKVINATTFEKSNKEIINSSFNYSKTKYQEDIDKILAESKKEGLGKEINIFLLQVQSKQLSEDNKTLNLSDSDREYLIYAAKIYEDFGSKIQSLETPAEYLKIANLLVNKSYDVATILRKMAIEEDPLLNAIWFDHYSEAVNIFYLSNKNNLDK